MSNIKIILEGVDGCGKSVLAEQIKDKFPEENFKIVHLTDKTPNTLSFFEGLLLSKDNLIFDRFHLSQMVYQTKEQRKANGWLSDRDYDEMESLINRMKAIVKVVYIDTDIDTCYVNCQKDLNDSGYTKEYIKILKAKYDAVIKKSKNDIMVYKNDFEAINNEVIKTLNFDSLPYIIAVDFDGLLATNSIANINVAVPNINLINELHNLQKACKHRIVLWTSRTGSSLNEAVEFCKKYGLEFDAVNDNIPELKVKGFNPRKIYADEYLGSKSRYMKFSIDEKGDAESEISPSVITSLNN